LMPAFDLALCLRMAWWGHLKLCAPDHANSDKT
jgi:hypothetical protein